MNFLYVIIPVLVVAWTIWGVFDYRQLKAKLARGEREALIKEYKFTIIGEVIGGFLALFAVGVSIWYTDPSFGIAVSAGMKRGLSSQLVSGGLGFVVAVAFLAIRSRRAKKEFVIGDIEAIIPRTIRERYYYVVVAVSAGIGEELVFRGFGLRLFSHLGAKGVLLLFLTSLVFGLAHIYQGVAGILATAVLGFVFSMAYIISGTLLLPIVLHALIDLNLLLRRLGRNSNY